MMRTGVAGAAAGVMFGLAIALYASLYGTDGGTLGPDTWLAWNFGYLPLIIGLAGAVWVLSRRSTRPLAHLAAFTLAAVAADRLMEEGIFGDALRGSDTLASRLTFVVAVVFVLAMIVGSLAFLLGGVMTRRKGHLA